MEVKCKKCWDEIDIAIKQSESVSKHTTLPIITAALDALCIRADQASQKTDTTSKIHNTQTTFPSTVCTLPRNSSGRPSVFGFVLVEGRYTASLPPGFALIRREGAAVSMRIVDVHSSLSYSLSFVTTNVHLSLSSSTVSVPT